MPSKKQYNLVNDDAYDCRIPLYNEEAFQHGITFHAKYIGSLDVPRPTSRVEIVAAMRRIRYEFKAKSIKKKKVSITISVDGVKILVRNKQKSNQWLWDENKFLVMQHPIYRIFYVSHDSQDLKIFSYIARDGGTNAFKCNVFKSKKKSQAMRIVRTVGQAFEVCHKLSLVVTSNTGCNPLQDDIDFAQLPDNFHKGDGASEPNSYDARVEEAKPQEVLSSESNAVPVAKTPASEVQRCSEEFNLSIFGQQVNLLRDQLNIQGQHVDEVSAQVQMLKDQLAAETNARLEVQAQNEQLLTYNRQLLEHITKLVQEFHELEDNCHHSTELKEILQKLSPPPKFPGPLVASASFPSSLKPINKVRKKNSSESPVMNHYFDGFSNPLDKSMSNISFPLQTSSPRLESRNHYLIGQSLPGTPIRRDFAEKTKPHQEDDDAVHTPQSSGTKYSSKDSSVSPRCPKANDDFFNDASFFKFDSVYHPENCVKPSLPHSYSSQMNGKESFVVQMTRDLAELQVCHNSLPFPESGFSPMFKKS